MEIITILAWVCWFAVGLGLIWLFFKIFETILWIVVGIVSSPFLLHTISNEKKTNLHYYDHPDRYFDYVKGQWFFKDLQ